MENDTLHELLSRLTHATKAAACGEKGAVDALTRLTDHSRVPKEIADLAEQIDMIVVHREIREYRLEMMVEDLLSAQSELAEAKHDSITGLPNRALFHEKLCKECEKAERGAPVALFFIDLDKFKQVNDTLGHDAGDELLALVSKRIESTVREGDVVSRLGGDEFTVILSAADERTVVRVAGRIIEDLGRPFSLHAGTVHIGASIGVSFFPADADTPIGLVKNADIAVYKAKEQGRNNFQFYREL